MKLIHFNRAISWIFLLIYTLFKFWIKHPQETPAILKFILEKIIASPRFFSRNILVEKHSNKIKKDLLQITRLYRIYGKSFNPQNEVCYKKLESLLPEKVQILYFLIRKIKPQVIVETGVAGGESTSFILQALYDNKKGKLYSIDLPFQWYIYGNHKLHLDSLPAGEMPGYLVPSKLKKNWSLHLGNTEGELPKLLKNIGEIDIFLHDSEHSDKIMLFEYTQSWPHIKKGGYLLSDDINYTNAFNSFSKKRNVKKIIFKGLGIIRKKKNI